MNAIVLNSNRATVYCFQFCGPVSMRSSIQRSQCGALYLPSMIQARYRPNGNDSRIAVKIMRSGRVHMLEPFGAQQGCEEINEQQQSHNGGKQQHEFPFSNLV